MKYTYQIQDIKKYGMELHQVTLYSNGTLIGTVNHMSKGGCIQWVANQIKGEVK